MTYHIPFCVYCNEHEVGAFGGSEQFCSDKCEDKYHREIEDYENDEREMFELALDI